MLTVVPKGATMSEHVKHALGVILCGILGVASYAVILLSLETNNRAWMALAIVTGFGSTVASVVLGIIIVQEEPKKLGK